MLMMILYLQGPKFIIEDDASRQNNAAVLYFCYGKIPGQSGSNPSNLVISGLDFDWDYTPLVNSTSAIFNSTCGLYLNAATLYDAEIIYTSNYGATAHLTMVFNAFVYYALFNQVTSRILNDDFNIFIRIEKNLMFVMVTIAEMGIQAIIVEFGSIAFQCSSGGLTGRQWGICIGFGLLCFPVNVLMKFIPMENCLDAMYKCWTERKFCKSKVEVGNVDESKRLAEEEQNLNVAGSPTNPNKVQELVALNLNNNNNNNNNYNVLDQNKHNTVNLHIQKKSSVGQIGQSKAPSFQSKKESKNQFNHLTSLRRSSHSVANRQLSIQQMREKKA